MVDTAVLTGVGVGPGDPDLLTLRGLAVLREAQLVVVPARDDAPDAPDTAGSAVSAVSAETDGIGHAERVVRAHLPEAPIVRAPFALTDRDGLTERRTRARDAAAALVVAAVDAGTSRIAFATVGDPNVYSTFGYLAASVRARRAGITIRTVPGITAMQALAAASGTVLCEGREPLVLLPLRDGSGDATARLDAVLTAEPDAALVVYKGGRAWPALRPALADRDRLDTAVVGSHLGRPAEAITPATEVDGELPYFSTVLAPPTRNDRGGKLR